jgi:hypothetical protein
MGWYFSESLFLTFNCLTHYQKWDLKKFIKNKGHNNFSYFSFALKKKQGGH